jgi:hypothetical protein
MPSWASVSPFQNGSLAAVLHSRIGCNLHPLSFPNTVIRKKLQTFINRCLRKILNIHWPEKIRTEELLELAGEEPVETSDVRWKIFPYGKFSAIFFQKIFRFLKSSLIIYFFNLFLVALGLRGCYTY